MARSFPSIAAFVAFMEGRVATLPGAQRRAMDKASTVVLEEAKSLPGTYQPGWPGLQPETIAHKSTGDSPLRETGAMAESYQRRVVSDREAAVGSDDPKATWQEMGTSRGIPPRPVLKAAAVRKEGEVRRIIAETVGRHLGGGSNR